MKKLLGIVVLGLLLSLSAKADDISEFEIEGMSIGDSLLDHYSKIILDKKSSALYPNKEMLAATFRSNSF
ncbi:hypothetical protein OAT26_05055, partial [Candidatus Pelagibacter sp.]|nr:hypothetical protein [Candidatus Pelagibacter sp.]